MKEIRLGVLPQGMTAVLCLFCRHSQSSILASNKALCVYNKHASMFECQIMIPASFHSKTYHTGASKCIYDGQK